MNSVSAIFAWDGNTRFSETIGSIKRCEIIKAKAAVMPSGISAGPAGFALIRVSNLWSKQAILDSMKWFSECGADCMLIINSGAPVLNPEGLRRMAACMHDTDASIIYGDYYDILQDGTSRIHPLIDYQPGSIRDNFDFGPAFLINRRFIEDIYKEIGKTSPDLVLGGLYDLRLRLIERDPAYHIPEPLYSCVTDGSSKTSSHFTYVDPRNRMYQLEMEKIAAAHLQRIGAFINPGAEPLVTTGDFPVKASVIIPVRNRSRTVSDAVTSALSQKTTFDYNVIVIDNHSNDGTTDILAKIA